MLGTVEETTSQAYSFDDSILTWIPENIVSSMAKMDMIPIIIFAVLFGVCIIMVGEKAKPLLLLLRQATR